MVIEKSLKLKKGYGTIKGPTSFGKCLRRRCHASGKRGKLLKKNCNKNITGSRPLISCVTSDSQTLSFTNCFLVYEIMFQYKSVFQPIWSLDIVAVENHTTFRYTYCNCGIFVPMHYALDRKLHGIAESVEVFNAIVINAVKLFVFGRSAT